MRSKEIVLAGLVKGHRTDPVRGPRWLYQHRIPLKMLLRSNGIPLWIQAWEAILKRRVKPGTEGLAACVDRRPRRAGWSWENALEVRTEEGENLHINECPAGYCKQGIRQAAREWFDKQQTDWQQKIWRNWKSRLSTLIARGEGRPERINGEQSWPVRSVHHEVPPTVSSQLSVVTRARDEPTSRS